MGGQSAQKYEILRMIIEAKKFKILEIDFFDFSMTDRRETKVG